MVDVPGAAFTTDLLGMRVVYAFTGRSSVNAFFQYNTDTHQVSSNVRFNLIHRPLSDLYVVYTHNWLEDIVAERFSTLDKRFASKVLYTHRF